MHQWPFFIHCMSSRYFKHTAFSNVKLHLVPAPLYEYSHFISGLLSWLADFDILVYLVLSLSFSLSDWRRGIWKKTKRETVSEKSMVCFAGPRGADEVIRFLFPIIFNRLNLHVAMATTTDDGTVLRYSYSWWKSNISMTERMRER